MAEKHETIQCLHCGEEIDRKVAACPHCGSDENTGWSENTYLDGIDTGDDIDYDESVENEFGRRPENGARKKRSWQMVVGAALLLLGALFLLRNFF